MNKQTWTIGSTVRVGFLQLKVLSNPIITLNNGKPNEFALSNLEGNKFYRFTPHNGLFRAKSLEDALYGQSNY